MVRKKISKKENLGLAEEHINLAETIVLEEAKNCEGEPQKLLGKAAFELEKAEADLEDAE